MLGIKLVLDGPEPDTIAQTRGHSVAGGKPDTHVLGGDFQHVTVFLPLLY